MNLDLRLTESEEILKTTAINFLKRDIKKETLEALHDSDTGFNEDIWRKVCDMGWLGIITPEEYGGTGYPLTTAGILFEALGTGPMSPAQQGPTGRDPACGLQETTPCRNRCRTS
jgi:alkylation response protein AidB-like acyl-CoA dehydrogenase